MIRFRTLLAVCAVALPIPAAIAGCGGDSSSDVDPQTVLDQTFNNDTKVTSGNLSLSLSGSAGDQGSFEAKLSGPFQGDPSNPNAVPQLDWTGSLTGSGAGTSLSFDGSLIVTEDNAYIEYGGNTYEVGSDLFNQFKQSAESAASKQSNQAQGMSFSDAFRQGCEQSVKAQGGDPSACDIDFESWLSDLSNDGTEDIEGAESDHVSGSLNVDTMLKDLIALGGSLPQASAIPSDQQIQQLSDAVTDASFDLYSRTEDHVLDGLDFHLTIDPSQIPQASASGVDSVDLSFSMRLGGINEDQTITAPSNAQPIDSLLRQLGVSPSDLGGLGGLGGATGGTGGGSSDAYLQCIQQATTAAEINQCANQL